MRTWDESLLVPLWVWWGEWWGEVWEAWWEAGRGCGRAWAEWGERAGEWFGVKEGEGEEGEGEEGYSPAEPGPDKRYLLAADPV